MRQAMKKNERYIGLMSGTSLDAVDAVLMDFTNDIPTLVTTHQHKISATLRNDIIDLCYPGENAIQRLGETDVKLGHLFADSVNELLKSKNIKAGDVCAVGSHGQTIRHMPYLKHRFTLQIGDPNIIAAATGITTVADFRRRDMALGGHAAPLAPAFHDYLFQNRKETVGVLNIGGIANITLLPPNKKQSIIGFDTGPGNTLMDAWCLQNNNTAYDKNGEWALSGTCNDALLQDLLSDAYFKKTFPKSTGREHFNLDWLAKHSIDQIKSEDVQATLLELTARSIIDALDDSITKLYVCGGGIHNVALIQRLNVLSNCAVTSIEECGIHPDWIEAAAFAWLARQTLLGKPGNIPSVTGAKSSCILGAIYPS